MSLDAPGDAHGPIAPQKHAGGRPPRRRLLSTNKFRELCIKHGPEALEIIMEIARSGEPDAARFLAAKFIIERGYGVADADAVTTPTQVTVITGVRERLGPDDPPPPRPLLPDGRNPFVEPAPCRVTEAPSAPAEPDFLDKFTTWPKQ